MYLSKDKSASICMLFIVLYPLIIGYSRNACIDHNVKLDSNRKKHANGSPNYFIVMHCF